MKTPIVLILILIMQASCNKFHDVYNDLDRTAWFKYQLKDTLIFTSQTKTNSYLISQLYTSYTINDKIYHDEYLNVVYSCNTENKDCPIAGFLRDLEDVTLYYGNTATNFSYKNLIPSTYQLGDSLLDDIYKVNCSQVDSIRYKIKTFYYSDIYGIIRYDMYNDEVFELQLK
jgi:hypothetical protein